MKDPTDAASLDEMVRTLADPRRRAILKRLSDGTGSTSIDELVDVLCAADVTDADVDPERLRIELHHVHLPKLEDAGLIDGTAAEINYLADERAERLLATLEREREPAAPEDIHVNR